MGLFNYFANERKKDDIASASRRMRERIVQTDIYEIGIDISRVDEGEWLDRTDMRKRDWVRLK